MVATIILAAAAVWAVCIAGGAAVARRCGRSVAPLVAICACGGPIGLAAVALSHRSRPAPRPLPTAAAALPALRSDLRPSEVGTLVIELEDGAA